MLEIKNLNLKLGAFQIRNLNLMVKTGEYFILTGPSGEGKTVFLETLAGFHKPESGTICFGGRNLTKLAPERRGIGLVYQHFELFPHLTIQKNIEFGLNIRKVRQVDAKKQVSKISEIFGLNHLLNRSPMHLSGGEKQRVAIARALVLKPDLLLMDEPFSALDHENRYKLTQELIRAHEAYGMTVLHISHDIQAAALPMSRIGFFCNKDSKQTRITIEEE